MQINTLANGTAATTSAVVATSAGLFQKIDAAPIPKGGIIMWSGAINTIPTGWYLCDGQTINGITTPNLQDKFVVGAGNTYAVADTGGSANAVVVDHTHTATNNVVDPGHTHLIFADNDSAAAGGPHFKSDNQNTRINNSQISVTGISVNTIITSTGVSGIDKNLPPYYALAYIMYGGI